MYSPVPLYYQEKFEEVNAELEETQDKVRSLEIQLEGSRQEIEGLEKDKQGLSEALQVMALMLAKRNQSDDTGWYEIDHVMLNSQPCLILQIDTKPKNLIFLIDGIYIDLFKKYIPEFSKDRMLNRESVWMSEASCSYMMDFVK